MSSHVCVRQLMWTFRNSVLHEFLIFNDAWDILQANNMQTTIINSILHELFIFSYVWDILPVNKMQTTIINSVLLEFFFYFQLCVRHLTSQQDADYHYKAVCRALAAEAAELTTFLDKVTRGNEVRKGLQSMAWNSESKVTIEIVTQHNLIFPFSNPHRDMFIHTISSLVQFTVSNMILYHDFLCLFC